MKWGEYIDSLRSGLETKGTKVNEFLQSDKSFKIGTGLLVATAALDAYLTVTGVKDPNYVEGNPIPEYFMQRFGDLEGTAIAKTLGLSGVYGLSKVGGGSEPLYVASGIEGIAAYSWLTKNPEIYDFLSSII